MGNPEKRIVLTGGGTAGHVTPNLALLPYLQREGFEVFYLGSYNGIEKRLLEDFDIPYYGIATGKFRRYFDFQNFSDPFRVLKGYREARKILKEIRPHILFSKGGFVSVPVVKAAASLKIPCILHESDVSPGLANKLCISSAAKICCNFPETMKILPAGKAVLTGSPIRDELAAGNPVAAYDLCGFSANKPVIMVIGGSLGSASINMTVREILPRLLDQFQVVHICGKDKVDNLMLTIPGYKQFEYLKSELKDIFSIADIVISRAGANAICELLALKKPNILVPLQSGSRGDQILNAGSFEEQGFSIVIREDHLDCSILLEKIHELYENKQHYIDTMNRCKQMNSVTAIIRLILEHCRKDGK